MMTNLLKRIFLGLALTLVFCGHAEAPIVSPAGPPKPTRAPTESDLDMSLDATPEFPSELIPIAKPKVWTVNNDPNVCDNQTIYCSIHKVIQEIKTDPASSHTIQIRESEEPYKEVGVIYLAYDEFDGKAFHLVGDEANKTIIDGKNVHAGIVIGEIAKVTIENLTIQNGANLIGSGGIQIGQYSEADVTIKNCRIINNKAGGETTFGGQIIPQPASGGGINNDSPNVTVTIENSEISDNMATQDGGGIHNKGTLKIINSTISRNVADRHGGGLYVEDDGKASILSTTIANNLANKKKYESPPAGRGGGIFIMPYNAEVEIANTILAGNTVYGFAGKNLPQELQLEECYGKFTSKDYNLIGAYWAGKGGMNCKIIGNTANNVYINIKHEESNLNKFYLDHLGDNGGPTQTHMLQVNSPARSKIPTTACVDFLNKPLNVDQRGFMRPTAGTCDIGAVEVHCGNKEKEPGEDCDEGGETAACDDDCTAVICGDGNVNAAAGEKCDDGNTSAGDGCSADCKTLEIGWNCTGEPSVCTTNCGDGIIAGLETCDDGNTSAGDGCSPTCTIEAGWACAGEPSTCSPDCGDGITAGSEECDTGGETATCDDDCSSVVCGDGNINKTAGELCDDNNSTGGDGCSADCSTVEVGWTCTSEPSVCKPIIGDGLIVGDEECDDGNTSSGDGCSSDGKIEPGYNCTGEPSDCEPLDVGEPGKPGEVTEPPEGKEAEEVGGVRVTGGGGCSLIRK